MQSMARYKSDEEQRREFFDTRTPEDPAYYSPRILEFYDYHTGEMLTKRGKEIMKRLRDMDWKEVLREYLRNWIKGMQMLHVVSTDFNTGNSSPAQYGWYPNSYISVAFDKLRKMVIEGHPTLKATPCSLESNFSWITVTRNLGYGKKVSRTINMSIEFGKPSHKRGINYKCKVTTYGDNGFYDEFVQYAKDLQAEMETFKKEPLLKTDLRPYDTYPDIASYKDKRDQLGIIRCFILHDTVGKRKNCKFRQGFIDAYKDARDFCKALPDINFAVSREAFYYKGKKYTADEFDRLEDEIPDELHYIGQIAEDVLIYKYGLLDTMFAQRYSSDMESHKSSELRYSEDTEVRQFIWHWRDKLRQPVTDDIRAWVDRWIPKERQDYVYGD